MRIVLSEEQFINLYKLEDRPMLVDVDFIVETEGEDEELDLGEPGDPNNHKLYYFYIGERFFDAFYDQVYLEIFDKFSKETDCEIFVDAVVKELLEKIKESVANQTASKILKKVIKNEKVVKFKLSDMKEIFQKHFGNMICHEFLQDVK